MAYTSGNKLAYDDSSATVLTDGMVMVTKGLGYGQQMKLVDWLILADGQEKLVVKTAPEVKAALPEATSVQPEATPVQPEVKRLQHDAKVGTKFHWELNPETYRIAIQTSSGFLQVKSVTDGGGEVHSNDCKCKVCSHPLYRVASQPKPLLVKKFADFVDWRASLPKGGKITTTLPDNRPMALKRADVPETFTDIEKLKRLEQNFKIRTTFAVSESPFEKAQRLMREMTAMSQDLTRRTPTATPEELKAMKRRSRRANNAYVRAALATHALTDAENKAKRYIYLQRGRSYVMVRCGGWTYRVTSCFDYASGVKMICRSDGRVFNNFKDMGADALMVHYRRKTITV